MKRRDFLIGSAGAGILGASGLAWHLGWLDLPETHEFYSSYGEWHPSTITDLDPPTRSYVVFFGPRNLRMRHYEVPLRVHSGVQDPVNKNFFVFITKWGETICSFDRASGRVLQEAKCAPGRRFFGHGVWDEASGGFWAVENDDPNNRGYLVLRNRELRTVREIPSHGVYPHEVQMPEPGVLQVANTGDLKKRHGSMAWIRAEDGRLLKSIEFKKESGEAGPSHFLRPAYYPDDLMIGGITAKEDQPSAVWRVSSGVVSRVQPSETFKGLFTGEVVSWAESRSQSKVLWTHAKSRAVFGLKLNSPAPARLEMPIYPHGMINDGDAVFVTKNTTVVRWNRGKLKNVARGPELQSSTWGSHIMRAEI